MAFFEEAAIPKVWENLKSNASNYMLKRITCSLIVMISFLFGPTGYGQSSERSLRTYLETIRDCHGKDSEPDPDSLVTIASNILVKILKNRVITENDGFPNLAISSSGDKGLLLYCIYFDTGGTSIQRGSYVLQWKNQDGSLGAYGLSQYMEKNDLLFHGFWEIVKLPSRNRSIYALIGGSTSGSVYSYDYIVQAVQIKNTYLILDYPAFFNTSSILVIRDHLDTDCGLDKRFKYDVASQVITYDCLSDEDTVGKFTGGYLKKKFGHHAVTFRWDENRFEMK